MDTRQIKTKLLEKERELLADIATLEQEARNAREAEVEDPIDEVTSAEGKAVAFEESSREWQTLRQVRDALQRIENSTYGKCMECGRPIEPARLEAVPWTPYCRADQEKYDRERAST